MAKDTFYFTHDFNARQDAKIKRLIMKHGMAGYGMFWSIVEDLYNNANALPTDYESIAFDLRSTTEIVISIIKDFGLFVVDGDTFGSMSVQGRLDARAAKSKKARDSAHKRWNNDANALPTDSDSNAIKERIVEESKSKHSKEIREITFREQVAQHTAFESSMRDSFADYWTESNEKGKKLKFEMQKTFDIGRRLKKWSSNNFGSSATKPHNQELDIDGTKEEDYPDITIPKR